MKSKTVAVTGQSCSKWVQTQMNDVLRSRKKLQTWPQKCCTELWRIMEEEGATQWSASLKWKSEAPTAWHWDPGKSQTSWSKSRFSRGNGDPWQLAWVHFKPGNASQGNQRISFLFWGTRLVDETVWAKRSEQWVVWMMTPGGNRLSACLQNVWIQGLMELGSLRRLHAYYLSSPPALWTNWDRRQKSKQTRANTAHLLLIKANLEDLD